MNLAHRWVCSSSRWKRVVEDQLLPWALDGIDLGSNVLEIGPGYGATTECLCHRVPRLTCIEVDAKLAESLRQHTLHRNVNVLCADATNIPLREASFDAVLCFTMLHHIASAQLQDQVLAQVSRVLRPGSVFAGTDSLDRPFFRLLHFRDTLTLVDPITFPDRLRAAGFEDVELSRNARAFRFRARKRS